MTGPREQTIRNAAGTLKEAVEKPERQSFCFWREGLEQEGEDDDSHGIFLIQFKVLLLYIHLVSGFFLSSVVWKFFTFHLYVPGGRGGHTQATIALFIPL